QAATGQRVWHANRERVENRREDVDMPCGLLYDAGFEEFRLKHDERNAERRLVGEDSMRGLSVLAERFAVIGREHHQRLPAMACRRDRLEQRSDRRVDGSNFAKVRVGKK